MNTKNTMNTMKVDAAVLVLVDAASHVQRYKLAELRAALAACLQTNVQLVSTGSDPKGALSQLLVKIISAA